MMSDTMDFDPELGYDWHETDWLRKACPLCERKDVESIPRVFKSGSKGDFFDYEFRCKCGCIFHHVWVIDAAPYGMYLESCGEPEPWEESE